MKTLSCKFYDGKEVVQYNLITNIQFLERNTDGSVYVITTLYDKRITVYGELISGELM